MSIAAHQLAIREAALDGSNTKDSLVAALAKVTVDFSADDVAKCTDLTKQLLAQMAAVLMPDVAFPPQSATRSVLAAAIHEELRKHASLQRHDQARRGRPKRSADVEALHARLGRIGDGQDDDEPDDDENEDPPADDSEHHDEDDVEVSDDDDAPPLVAPPRRAGVVPPPPPASARPGVSVASHQAVVAELARLKKQVQAQAKAVASASHDAVAQLIASALSLHSPTASSSAAAAASYSDRDRQLEMRMVRVLFGFDALLIDLLPEEVTSDKRHFEDVRGVLESIYSMDAGRPIPFVNGLEWTHDKFKFEALRWADTIQQVFDQVALDVARSGAFLLTLVQPVWRIHALVQYDQTGDDSFLDAVTPMTGSMLSASAFTKFEAARRAIEARKSPKTYRKSAKPAASASSAKQQPDDVTPEASPGKANQKSAPKSAGSS
jgi:hypothetical protein